MKVLIINTFYYPHEIGGAEKSVRILAEGLVKKDIDVTVLCLSDQGKLENNIINGVNIYRVPVKNIYNPAVSSANTNKPGKFKRLGWHFIDMYNIFSCTYVSRVMEQQFDIVHTNNLSGFSVSLWSWARNNKIPILHTSRDYYLFNPNCTLYSNGKNENPASFKVKFLSYIKKIVSRKVDGYIGISNYIHNLHVEHGFFSHSKISDVIYNSIGRSSDVNYQKQRGLTLNLGYVGRLDDAKGIDKIIDYLKNTNLQFSLKIAGKGERQFVSKLQEKCNGDSRFLFVGHVGINEYFQNIDCLICPSIWNEPMGRVVIEAYSYGVPVIANKVGGVQELIELGKTGFLFDINSSESLMSALSQYQKATYSSLVENCLKKAMDFNDEKYVNSYVDAYNKVINKSF